MEPIIWMSLGAAGVIALILTRLAANHGWAWVQAKLKERATDAEADLKQKFSGVIGDIDARIRDVVHSELAKLDSEIATLKTRVGI